MPKLKINKFDGLYTNIDENDTRLEIFRESINFKHENGYAEIEPRHLSEYALPNIEAHLGGTLGQGWTWERGTYVIITNDPLSENLTPAKYEVLFLVAKKVEGSTTHRLFWFKELPSGEWYELSKNGNYANLFLVNHNGVNFDDSLVSTTKEGEVFFRHEGGVLKIHLPHDTFWFGRIERTIYGTDITAPTLNQFYLDRLVEPFDKDNLGTDFVTTVGSNGETVPVRSQPICAAGRRLGIAAEPSVVDTQAEVVDESEVDFVYQGTFEAFGINWHKFQVADKETGKLYPRLRETIQVQYEGSDSTTGTIPLPYDSFTHVFPEKFGTTQMMLFEEYMTAYQFADGSSLGTVFSTTEGFPVIEGHSGQTWHWHLEEPTTVRIIEISTFNSKNDSPGYSKIGGGTVADIGFSNTKTNYELIATQVLDDKEEIIVWRYTADVDTSETKYALKIEWNYPCIDINHRLTRTRFYIKFAGDTDYELIKDINYLDPNLGVVSTFYITESSLLGITLSQNIGFLFDSEKAEDYEIITGFKSYAVENGIGIGLSINDYVNVYHSTVGGGVLMSDLIYTANILPLPNLSFVNAVASVNGTIAAISDKSTFIIKADEVSGQLAFTINDTMEYGVKNIRDVASIQNGILIHTRNGIFFTNGFDKELLSEPINNIIEQHYDTGRIEYNSHLHEIYYIDGVFDFFYRFRMKRGKWEKIAMDYATVSLSNVNDILIDFDGHPNYLQSDSFFVYDASDLVVPAVLLQTNNSDLGEPSLDKLLNFIDLDFKGPITVLVYYENVGTFFITANSATRITKRLYVPLKNRKPAKKIKFGFAAADSTTILYGMEIDFIVMEYRYQ